jgi:hypothetical protein
MGTAYISPLHTHCHVLLRERADGVARRLAVLEALMYSKDATKVGLVEWLRWELLSSHFGITSDSTTAFLFTGAVGVALRFRMVDAAGVFRFGLDVVGPNGELYTDYAESLESYARCGLSVVAGMCSNSLGLYQHDLPSTFREPNLALNARPCGGGQTSSHNTPAKRATGPFPTPGRETTTTAATPSATTPTTETTLATGPASALDQPLSCGAGYGLGDEECSDPTDAAVRMLVRSDAVVRVLQTAGAQLAPGPARIHFRLRSKVLPLFCRSSPVLPPHRP